ncbi:WhiB family transcriptional regulator [Streptomyces sp. S1D4-11]
MRTSRMGYGRLTARELCAGCGHLDACRVYGLENPELYGVWGGTTRRERQALRRGSLGIGGRRGGGWRRSAGLRAPGGEKRPGRRCAHRVTG